MSESKKVPAEDIRAFHEAVSRVVDDPFKGMSVNGEYVGGRHTATRFRLATDEHTVHEGVSTRMKSTGTGHLIAQGEENGGTAEKYTKTDNYIVHFVRTDFTDGMAPNVLMNSVAWTGGSDRAGSADLPASQVDTVFNNQYGVSADTEIGIGQDKAPKVDSKMEVEVWRNGKKRAVLTGGRAVKAAEIVLGRAKRNLDRATKENEEYLKKY
jgi:hypothetical protein